MKSVDDVLANHKPSHATARILLDGDLRDELGRLEARIRQAQLAEQRGGVDVSDPSSPVPRLLKEYEQLAQKAEDAKTEFEFRQLPNDDVRDIKDRYPPSKERWARYREEAKGNPWASVPQWDSDAAAPELIALSLVSIDGEDVDWDEAAAAKLWKSLGEGQASYLFNQMWSVQSDSAAAPLSVTVTGETGGSEPSSTTPPVTESPSQSS